MRTIPTEKLEAKYGYPNSQYITVDGTKVHYLVDGNPNGEPLVLLHGVLASTHTWDGWVEQMKDDYYILRVDLPGFGLSEPLASKDYTPEYAVKFFEMLRLELAKTYPMANQPFNLVGNSLGGFVAWYYSTKHPELVKRMILIDPIAYQQEMPRIIRFCSKGFGGAMAKMASLRSIVKKNVKQVYGHPESVTDETVLRYHELLLMDGHKESMVEYFKTLRKYNEENTVAQHVKEISVPTLLMWGGKDRWVPPELVEKWKADVNGLQVHVYPEGGHIPMEEFPAETSRDAEAFLGAGGATGVAAQQPQADPPGWGQTYSAAD